MTVQFSVSDSGARFRFTRNGQAISPEIWAMAADIAGRAAVDALRRLESAGHAAIDDAGAHLDHAGITQLSSPEAAALGLPPPAEVVLCLAMSPGVPPERIDARWIRPDGRPILSAQRHGAFLRVGEKEFRLPDPLYGIATAVSEYQTASRDDPDERTRRLVALKAALPQQPDPLVVANGMLPAMRIAYAESFSLEAGGSAADPEILPVLHARAPDADSGQEEALLPRAYQEAFAQRAFRAQANARAAYTLGDGWYVALSRPLQDALQVVREAQDAPTAERRDFLRNPSSWLQHRLGPEHDPVIIETLFRETEGYSERVKGLGFWQPRVLPWIRRPPADWFGPPEFGLDLGGERLRIPPEQLPGLATRIEAAIARGEPSVRVPEPDGPVVPATAEAREAVLALQHAQLPAPAGFAEEMLAAPAAPCGQQKILLIATNEDASDYQRGLVRRQPPLPQGFPACLGAVLKPHQEAGLEWLRQAWNAGRPGVLLADDMGLGKTLQCLAFLAQLREAMQAKCLPQGPILIVAPVGLLQNWVEEHDRHLRGGGLGRLRRAFGSGLTELRLPAASGRVPRSLDRKALAESDWVLTTYEALRDNQKDFGEISFAAVVFDEAQRIKNPGTRVTDAAKALKSGFWLALTGTPVENRLADLWCIIDTVQPGFFPELKAFSARYEQAPEPEALLGLKRALEEETANAPAIMMRRMKVQQLQGLPAKTETRLPRGMPQVQADAYRAVLSAARVDVTRAGKLRALQRLRAISLHPSASMSADDDVFVAASARLSAFCEALDRIADQKEKALVFLEDLDMQARLCGVLQRRYRLVRAPAIINGSVDGAKRQDRVNAFQAASAGFGLMILSPRAAGVGITLTAASHVIHLSRWWNPAVEDQCTDRAYRLGQTRDVTVHLPMALLPGEEARSFDHNLNALLQRKRSMAAELLMPPAPTAADEDALFRQTIGS